MKVQIASLLLAVAFVAGPVMAQAPSPAPAKPSMLARMKAATHPKPGATQAAAKPAVKAVAPAPAAVANKGQAPRTAQSLQCSKQADAKNIHGKARKSFMSHCKKA